MSTTHNEALQHIPGLADRACLAGPLERHDGLRHRNRSKLPDCRGWPATGATVRDECGSLETARETCAGAATPRTCFGRTQRPSVGDARQMAIDRVFPDCNNVKFLKAFAVLRCSGWIIRLRVSP